MNEDTVHWLLEKYAGSRIVRALIQLIQIPLGQFSIGLGGAIDVVLMQTLANIRRDRAKSFFDELDRGNVLIDESLLQSEDFLHCYFATAKYALNSRRREKIQMFARLLKSSLSSDGPQGVDEYEDFLKILDELSYRELQALKILDTFSDRERKKDQNEIQWVTILQTMKNSMP